eukprot:Filipodium_phascolosomae@DN6985_c0_g1_i1.p1
MPQVNLPIVTKPRRRRSDGSLQMWYLLEEQRRQQRVLLLECASALRNVYSVGEGAGLVTGDTHLALSLTRSSIAIIANTHYQSRALFHLHYWLTSAPHTCHIVHKC